ncbi:hypothetical protein SAMN05428961_11341 [Paenibacillus sp. OK060]|nr:hypothetical protein SAMN05428961_11341 [Paenibacillus sp. OK060]
MNGWIMRVPQTPQLNDSRYERKTPIIKNSKESSTALENFSTVLSKMLDNKTCR